jgi:hypothetical protein
MNNMATETPTGRPDLVTSRKPVGPRHPTGSGSVGDQALMDALIIIGAAWLVLLYLTFSLRSFNI